MSSGAEELLKRHFDIALETPDGVKKLRELILTLAMQGKLVKQDPKDQPASELLKEIAAEKKILFKEGKIRKQDSLPPIKLEDIPYEIPRAWEWVRLSEIVNVGTGSTPATTNHSYYNGTIPWYTSSATNNPMAAEPEKFITEKAIKETNCKIFPMGSLIIALYGQGKTRGQISEIVIPGATNQAIAAMVFYEYSQSIKLYLKYFFVKIYSEIRLLAAGAAQPNLNVGKIKTTLIPLPPLAEQKRIVAKIDQLMSLCDKLASERNERSNKRLKIHTAAINKLITAPDKSEFNSSRNFITKNFSELYSVKENVEELKKAILQLAVMGKLVKQDPRDQPASELLKEIEAEKKRLVKEGNIRQHEPLPPIKLGETPYELPHGWEWRRLISIGKWAIGSGFPLSIQGEENNDVLMCKVSDMNLLGNEKYIVTTNNTISAGGKRGGGKRGSNL